MTIRNTLLVAAAVLGALTVTASAQNYGPPRADPNGYYSQADQSGYYDRNGRYRRMRPDFDRRDRNDGPRGEGVYYRQGDYERSCQSGNAAAGTIFGAVAGGLIGGGVSHGNGGAVVGGAVLGGLLGNTISRDISCDDQPQAFQVYSDGLNGDVGRRYDWNHGEARGYFQPTREFRRSGTICRDFTETTYRGGRELTRSGTACRADDGNWRFD